MSTQTQKNIFLVIISFTLGSIITYIFLMYFGFSATKEINFQPIATSTNVSETPDTKTDTPEITSPLPNTKITSPLTIYGKAKGSWFFEATFPIDILNKNKQVIGSGFAKATGDWMTADSVPFTATVTFTSPVGETGEIVFKKDNPSGLPQNDGEFHLPVTF